MWVVSIRQSAEKVQKMEALHNALLYTDPARCYRHLEKGIVLPLGYMNVNLPAPDWSIALGALPRLDVCA